MWPIGMMLWRIGELLDFYEQMEWISAAGFDAIGFHASPGLPGEWRGVDPTTLDTSGRRALRDRLQAGFRRVEIHAPFSITLTAQSGPDAFAELGPIIEFAGEVGADILTVHAVPPTDEQSSAEWQAVVGRLDALAAGAEVTIALENLGGRPWFKGPRMSRVGTNLDIGHLHLSIMAGAESLASVVDAVRTTGSALVHSHVHDVIGEQDHVQLGTGEIDFTDFCRALFEVQYRGFLCLELNPQLVSPTAMQQSRHSLMRAIEAAAAG